MPLDLQRLTEQISQMIKTILSIKNDIKSYDASDAIACAICHANTVRHERQRL